MTKVQSTPVAGRPDGPEAAAYLGTTFGTRVISVRDLVEAFGQSLGSVFFIGRPWLGLLLWGALLSRPALALFALCGLLSGVLVQGVLRVLDEPGLGGGIKANALLTAVVAGWSTPSGDAEPSGACCLSLSQSLNLMRNRPIWPNASQLREFESQPAWYKS